MGAALWTHFLRQAVIKACVPEPWYRVLILCERCCSEWYHRETLFREGLSQPGKEVQVGDLVMSGVRQPCSCLLA